MKNKEFWDDLLYSISRLKANIYRFFVGLKRWFSYFKVLIKVYDFDYSSILEVERYQLIRVRDSILKFKSHIDWRLDVNRINLAIKLLDIMIEDGCSTIVNQDFDILNLDSHEWTIPVYVNTKNSKRFYKRLNPEDFQNEKIGALWKDNLRVEKAWHLYHRLRLQYLRTFWD